LSTPRPLDERDFAERFAQLDAFLIEHQALWRPRPFTHLQLPWESQHAALANWLRSRSLAQAEDAHNAPAQLDAPAPFAAWAERATALASVGALPSHACREAHSAPSDVPGRKWQQITAFAERLTFAKPPSHWLDWCSGKGHLGHLLAASGTPLTCLEYDRELVDAGIRLADRQGLEHTEHRCQDVLAEDCARLLGGRTPVALHACGDLHRKLLRDATQARSPALAVAPCCYNRCQAALYQPLSMPGVASTLRLDRDDLGLPLSETVTAGQRVRRQRDLSMARRLGFDLLQRRLRGVDTYLPTPSLSVAWLQRPYADYCRELGRRKALEVPEQDWAALEADGWRRLAEVRNLELVRGLFRRPLELWLQLDLALYLSEHGYRVRLGSFCALQLTPRNLMLLAERM